jgi:hypothetical protein
MSDEVVETMMASTASELRPATSKARHAACAAKSEAASSSEARYRVRMPVRRSIAAALSPSERPTSSLSTLVLGTYDPVPTILLSRTVFPAPLQDRLALGPSDYSDRSEMRQ